MAKNNRSSSYWRFNDRSEVDPYRYDDSYDESGDDTHHVFQKPGTYQVRLQSYRKDAQPETVVTEVTVVALPSPGMRVLEGTAHGVARGIMHGYSATRVAAHVASVPVRVAAKPVIALPTKILVWAVSLVGCVSLGFGFYAAAPAPAVISVVTSAPIMYTGMGLVGLALGFTLIYVAAITGLILAMRNVIFKPAVVGTKHGALGFGQVMKIGYKAVKSNTCPRVMIEDECSSES